MGGLLSRPTRKFLFSLLPEVAGFAVAAVFAYTGSNISLSTILIVLTVAILAATVAEYYVTYKPIIDFRERELSTFFKRYLSLVENQFESMIADDADIRANIMLRKSKGAISVRGKEFVRTFGDDFIRVEYVADEDDYDQEELDLEFEIGQGCCGRVLDENDQFISVSPAHTHAWDSSWGTTEQQDRVTHHLNIIIGTPIYRPSDENKDRPIGVFIVDSENDLRELFKLDTNVELADVNFKQTDLAREAIRHARNVGILL